MEENEFGATVLELQQQQQQQQLTAGQKGERERERETSKNRFRSSSFPFFLLKEDWSVLRGRTWCWEAALECRGKLASLLALHQRIH